MPKDLLQKEEFTSIQEAQAGLARLLVRAERTSSFYRVLKNNKPIGVLLPNRTWEGLLEDLAALKSPSYLRNIEAARKERGLISARRARKLLGL